MSRLRMRSSTSSFRIKMRLGLDGLHVRYNPRTERDAGSGGQSKVEWETCEGEDEDENSGCLPKTRAKIR